MAFVQVHAEDCALQPEHKGVRGREPRAPFNTRFVAPPVKSELRFSIGGGGPSSIIMPLRAQGHPVER